MSGVQVQLRRVVTVSADKITGLQATTASGVVLNVLGPVSVGDYSIVDETGKQSVLSAADYAAELVVVPGAAA